MKSSKLILLLLIALTSLNSTAKEKPLRLWYDKPATEWMTEALPLGNGYMGAMFFGGVEKEQIQFTEGTLWSGGPGANEQYNYQPAEAHANPSDPNCHTHYFSKNHLAGDRFALTHH